MLATTRKRNRDPTGEMDLIAGVLALLAFVCVSGALSFGLI